MCFECLPKELAVDPSPRIINPGMRISDKTLNLSFSPVLHSDVSKFALSIETKPQTLTQLFQAVIDCKSTCYGPIAQRLEQGTHNPLVKGSNPFGPSHLQKFACTSCLHQNDPHPRFLVCFGLREMTPLSGIRRNGCGRTSSLR